MIQEKYNNLHGVLALLCSHPLSVSLSLSAASSHHEEIWNWWRCYQGETSPNREMQCFLKMKEVVFLWLAAMLMAFSLLTYGWRLMTCIMHWNISTLYQNLFLCLFLNDNVQAFLRLPWSKEQKSQSRVFIVESRNLHPLPSQTVSRPSSYKLTNMLPSTNAGTGGSAYMLWLTKSHSFLVHVNETLAPLLSSKTLLSADSCHFTMGLWASRSRAELKLRMKNDCFTCFLSHLFILPFLDWRFVMSC